MTDTERITHAVCDRHAGLPLEAEKLGQLAAEHELEAARDDTPPWLRYRLMKLAQQYRDAQTEQIRVNPYRKLDDWGTVHRAELEDQAQAIKAYPHANILAPSPIVAALRAAASTLRAYPSIIFAVILVIVVLFILL